MTPPFSLRRALALLALCAWTLLATAAVDPDQLLPVDEAFVLRVEAPSVERVAVSWAIAEGYYLYRHRTAVEVIAGASEAGTLRLPAGKRHVDEFFGEVETYRGRLGAELPITAPAGSRELHLRVKYQGCADLGVCYPPQVRTVRVALPAGAAAASTGAGMAPTADAGFTALGRALGGTALPAPLAGARIAGANDPLPLPPEQAFGFEAIAGDANTLLLRFTPARGYYLYRDRTTLRLDASDIRLSLPRWPRGVAHRDEHFGQVVVYFDQVDVPVPLRRGPGEARMVRLTATFQGCQADGICYPPMTRVVAVSLPALAAGAVAADAALPTDVSGASDQSPAPDGAAAIADAAGTWSDADDRWVAGVTPTPGMPAASAASLPANAPTGVDLADDSRLAAALTGAGRWWALLGFFGAGLLLAFTPCVLPMIPILAGLIAGAGTRLGTGRALLLSFVYVLANALVFTVAGVFAALAGANLQVAFQTPWIIVLFAALFVALALSSFGLYELQLPRALRARLGALTERQRGGSLPGVAAMGALSALIVGPCVAPPLAAAVLYIGQTQDPVFGGAALFLLGMGMGAPLLAFGVAAGRGMPTSGPWMVAAQRVFGFVFLALAVWMLSRILPGPAALALYGLLALAAAAAAFSALPRVQSERGRWLARFAGLLLAVVGAAQLLGALGGGRDPLQPLAGVLGQREHRELPFRSLKSVEDLEREVAAAQAAGKPLLLDFYADWCVACKEMEKYTFSQGEVHDALDGFVLLKADVTANDAVDQALMRQLGIIGPPATLFYVGGQERRELRLFGFEKSAPFVARVRRAVEAR
ncbi:protein-disulfide reductase DsbD [soil metagenome]